MIERAEIEARNALTEACPVDVYAYSISPRWSWPWKLQSYYEARPGAADSCDSLLIDSGSRRVGTMHGIIEAVEKTDADAVIPLDPTPKTDAYDDLTPSVHASETASHYWTAVERLPDDCDVLVPIHPPYVDYLDVLRSWDPERVQGYRDDPAFDYPQSERERDQYLAGRANYSLTYDLVDAAGGVAVGGLLALDVDDRRVLVVPDRVWSDLQARLDLEADVLDAGRLAHTRMAETLVVDAGASEYRRFSKEYDALVV